MSLEPDEIDGLDLVWIGIDKSEQVAAFVTAGSGYVPPTAFDGISDVEKLILEQSPRCECKLHIDVPRPDSYVALAQRGYFVFDWAQVGEHDSYYELAARPLVPIRASDLSTVLGRIAKRTKISNHLFSDCEFLEVASLS